MNEQTQDVTPASKNKTHRSKIITVGAIGIAAFGTLLIIDDQVKKFKSRKTDKSTETDNPTQD